MSDAGQGKFAREPDHNRIPAFFFGGTFDPPHRGHYRIVSHLLRANTRARVIVMPAAASPLRDDARLFTYRERFHFLRELFRHEIAAGRVVLSQLEKKLPRPNYTYDTLKALAELCPEKPALVIGADQAANLQRWHKAEVLIREYSFVVFARRGSTVALPAACRADVVADFDEDISATALRAVLLSLPPAARRAEIQRMLDSGA